MSLDANGAEIMAEIGYQFGAAVVELSPTMTIAEVNAALAASNSVVFMHAGIYTGDIVFSGSNVTQQRGACRNGIAQRLPDAGVV